MKPDVKNTFRIYDPDRSSPGRHFYAFQFDNVETLQRWTESPENLRRMAALITRAWTHDLNREWLIERAKSAIRRAIEFGTTEDSKL